MSKIYFTSDMHFGHANIIEFTKTRKFNSVEDMNEELIRRWNSVVHKEDLVYHVGDFAFRSNNSARQWEERLNGTIVHIEGNHDHNNGVKTLIVKCIMHAGGNSIYVEHRPPHKPEEIPYGVSFVICGHVHDKYKHKWVGSIPVINVGTDVWGLQPVSIESILKYYRKIIKEKKRHASKN